MLPKSDEDVWQFDFMSIQQEIVEALGFDSTNAVWEFQLMQIQLWMNEYSLELSSMRNVDSPKYFKVQIPEGARFHTSTLPFGFCGWNIFDILTGESWYEIKVGYQPPE